MKYQWIISDHGILIILNQYTIICIYIHDHIYIDIQYIDYTSLMKYHLNHIWSKKAAYFRSQYAVRFATGKRRGPSGAEDGFLSGENLTKWWEYLWKSKILYIYTYIYITRWLYVYISILYYISEILMILWMLAKSCTSS